MTTERAMGALGLLLTALAVAPQAETLHSRWKAHRARTQAEQDARDERFYAMEEARFQREWNGGAGILR